ncbi:MAG: molybdate ABC transporter substrate-binding protein [Thermoleophilaceae bacterium]|jgi:molybdate transport system substrate-binding protein|nr:molybdate ABC transporter substrate-binding protein [Thermoleophilaceae bacterium]
MRRGLPPAPALVVLLATITGCGGDDGGSGDGDELTVSAASSLTEAFQEYGPTLEPTETKFSFGGSDELAAQIRQGAAPDVFASANTELPDALHDEGLVEQPAVFATNTLVLAVPSDSQIDAIDDLTEPGLDLVIGAPDVPFGSYTRTVLERLPPEDSQAILDNVRSEESDVKAAIGKLTQGAADASFTYTSDVAAAEELEAIQLPRELQPDVAYGIAVASEAENPEGAQEFIDGLLSGEGATILEASGFKPPPGG